MRKIYACPDIDIEKLYINDIINETDSDDTEEDFTIISGVMQPTDEQFSHNKKSQVIIKITWDFFV